MAGSSFLSFWPDQSDHYDPDYEFLQQDLSNADQIPQQVPTILSPLPESLGESGSPFHGHAFQLPQGSSSPLEFCSLSGAVQPTETPPALPEKKRRSAASQTSDSSCRVSYERHPSQYDNISEDDMQNAGSLSSVPCTPFAPILPFQQGNSSTPVEFIADFAAPDSNSDPEKPPPLPEKKNKHSKQDLVFGFYFYLSLFFQLPCFWRPLSNGDPKLMPLA